MDILTAEDSGHDVTCANISTEAMPDLHTDMYERAKAMRYHFVQKVMNGMMKCFQHDLYHLNRSFYQQMADGYVKAQMSVLEFFKFLTHHARNSLIGYGMGKGMGAIATVAITVFAPHVALVSNQLQDAGAAVGVAAACGNALKHMEEKLKENTEDWRQRNNMKNFLLEVVGDPERLFTVVAQFADTLQQEIVHFLCLLKWNNNAEVLAEILTRLAIDGIKTKFSWQLGKRAPVNVIVKQLVKWSRREKDDPVLKSLLSVKKWFGEKKKSFKVEPTALLGLRKCYVENKNKNVYERAVFGYLHNNLKNFSFSNIMHHPEGYSITRHGGNEMLNSFIWTDEDMRIKARKLPPRVFISDPGLPAGMQNNNHNFLNSLPKISLQMRLKYWGPKKAEELALVQLKSLFTKKYRSFMRKVHIKWGNLANIFAEYRGGEEAKNRVRNLCVAFDSAVAEAQEALSSSKKLLQEVQKIKLYPNGKPNGSINGLDRATDANAVLMNMDLTKAKINKWYDQCQQANSLLAKSEVDIAAEKCKNIVTRSEDVYDSAKQACDIVTKHLDEAERLILKFNDEQTIITWNIEVADTVVTTSKSGVSVLQLLFDTKGHKISAEEMNCIQNATRSVKRLTETAENFSSTVSSSAMKIKSISDRLKALDTEINESKNIISKCSEEMSKCSTDVDKIMRVLGVHMGLHPKALTIKAALFLVSHLGQHSMHFLSVSLPTAAGHVCTSAFPLSVGLNIIQDVVLVHQKAKSAKKAVIQHAVVVVAAAGALFLGPTHFIGWSLFASGQATYYGIERFYKDFERTKTV